MFFSNFDQLNQEVKNIFGESFPEEEFESLSYEEKTTLLKILFSIVDEVKGLNQLSREDQIVILLKHFTNLPPFPFQERKTT